MRCIRFILVTTFCLAIGIAYAQQKANSKQPSKGHAKTFRPPVYFGNSDYKGGPIDKQRFAELLQQGLSAHDSVGNKYKILGFDFGYSEQKIYEDSIGNIMKVMDFSSEYCRGDTISRDIARDGDTTENGDVALSIYHRVKPGDTVYFDNIMLEVSGHNSLLSIPDTIAFAGRPIKCIIVK